MDLPDGVYHFYKTINFYKISNYILFILFHSLYRNCPNKNKNIRKYDDP